MPTCLPIKALYQILSRQDRIAVSVKVPKTASCDLSTASTKLNNAAMNIFEPARALENYAQILRKNHGMWVWPPSSARWESEMKDYPPMLRPESGM
jgi:hypothetical protein